MKRCKYCHSTENLTIDHKQPVIKGGTNELKNLQCLCKPCNEMKSDIPDRRLIGLAVWFAKTRKFQKIIKYTTDV